MSQGASGSKGTVQWRRTNFLDNMSEQEPEDEISEWVASDRAANNVGDIRKALL